MKYKYKFHPSDYELGENEQFYSDMEAKGWKLVKRGGNLSKFISVEPSRARYRIEVSSPGFLEQAVLSEGQLAVYEDCGWSYVTDRGFLYVFRAPAGAEAPEFYNDPAQQAETLKQMKRNAVWGWAAPAVIWGLYFLMLISLRGSVKIAADFQRGLVEGTSLYLFAGVGLADGTYLTVRNGWLISRTYRRLKKGVPLDHNPQKRHLAHKIIHRSLLAVLALLAALMAAQWIAARPADLPEEAGGPYLLARDLGWEGKRKTFMNHGSVVTHARSLLAEFWKTEEYLDVGPDAAFHLCQDVYRLRNAGMSFGMADTLRKTSTFGRGGGNFTILETDAVDAAWYNDLEVVAVKGPYVACVTITGWGREHTEQLAVCEALAARWDAKGSFPPLANPG